MHEDAAHRKRREKGTRRTQSKRSQSRTVEPEVLAYLIAVTPLQETGRKISVVFQKDEDPIIKAPPASHSSGEDSRRSNHRKPLLLISPEPTDRYLVFSRTVRVQYWTTVDTLNCSNRAQAVSVENIHLLSPVSERRTGTRPVPRKAAKKRCSTREREESAPTTNRRTRLARGQPGRKKKNTGHPWCASAHMCDALRSARCACTCRRRKR